MASDKTLSSKKGVVTKLVNSNAEIWPDYTRWFFHIQLRFLGLYLILKIFKNHFYSFKEAEFSVLWENSLEESGSPGS